MGWTKAYETELWSGTDLDNYQGQNFLVWDRVREGYLSGIGHWYAVPPCQNYWPRSMLTILFPRHLAPLWVLPDHQGRGVASLLLRDGIELADREDPSPPMYLEAMPEARVIYEHFGYQGVEGEGEGFAMIRNPLEGVKPLAKKS